MDFQLNEIERWVLIAPPSSKETSILLANADTEKQSNSIGNQTGGRVLLILQTNDFWSDYKKMITNGIDFEEAPREEIYGTVAIFKDLYGNKWDLLEPK